jgi:hypothetical protein
MRIKLYKEINHKLAEWHSWYAWYPVILEGFLDKPKIVWLEHVERREYDGRYWIYRFPRTE